MRFFYILFIILSLIVGQEMIWQENGIPIRQGVHIEWQRTLCPGESGSMIFVWSDTRYGSRNVFAQKRSVGVKITLKIVETSAKVSGTEERRESIEGQNGFKVD